MENIRQFLENSLARKRLAHSYLIIGAEAWLHSGEELDAISSFAIEPHSFCSSASALQAERLIIQQNEKKVIQRKEVERILSFSSLKPVLSKRKLVVILNAHFLTLPAANYLLKIIEEPPRYLIFFLLTSRPEMLPATVFSRCVTIKHHNDPKERAFLTPEEKNFYAQLLQLDLNQRFLLAEKLATKEKHEIIRFLNQWLVFLEKDLYSGTLIYPQAIKIIRAIKKAKNILELTNASTRVLLENLMLQTHKP